LLDAKVRDGEFKLILPHKAPFVLGHDAAGVVSVSAWFDAGRNHTGRSHARQMDLGLQKARVGRESITFPTPTTFTVVVSRRVPPRLERGRNPGSELRRAPGIEQLEDLV